ncbi:MAG: RluA family pseudouridine synthase [Phaeodactylibacter sp.]|nr:RluA family pseudouridine synthase [Phaeodactylibacter sp.]MCB9050833.1 RluA family pseudouridine synthase [Lewinellaceae bacterium]
MPRKRPQHTAHQVKDVAPNTRLIDYCRRAFPLLGSKTAVKKAIAGGRLLHNGKPARMEAIVRKGDQLELQGAGLQQARDFDMELEILYEDDYLLVANKPAGIAVNGNRIKTLENAVAGALKPSGQPDALPRPVAVHRIDVPTRGLVLLAKTKSALISLSRAFEQNAVRKEYVAVVHGKLPEKGIIDAPIQGKEAVTKFETVEVAPSRVFKHLSLARLRPVTGRTHQLRIHLQGNGHLIVGDKAYAGKQQTILGKGLFLCACRLEFTHPAANEPVVVEIPPPPRFLKLLERERERYG